MPPLNYLAPDNGQGEEEMANETSGCGGPSLTESGNIIGAMSALAQGFGAAAVRRSDAADQLASDSQRMWSIAMTSPTVMAAHGMRVANESGAGRTRAETNAPAETGAGK
jgi:hypothetical protein